VNISSKQLNNYLVHNWCWAASVTIFALLLLIKIYYNTLLLMISAWNTSTFAHCYLILPISCYLIWRKKLNLIQITPLSEVFPISIIAALGFCWLIGYLADAMVIQEFAFVVMIPSLVWVLLGRNVVREILFPLGFLLFCVPFGDFLLPSLMEFTANFTVGLIGLTGIPVYREGNFFSIPSGDWSVVEACAGLRYLIASITLGTLFSYLNFRSLYRQILFTILSGIVPIILNGIRAFMIVMIGHFSGMKLGVGEDHFIYGWIFFGLGMTLLFWVGSKWGENVKPEMLISDVLLVSKKQNKQRIFILAFFALIISAVWPLSAEYINQYSNNKNNDYELVKPEPRPPWRETESFTTWKPTYQDANVEKQIFYTDGKYTIGVFIEYYLIEVQGHELINSENVLIPENHLIWKLLQERSTIINYKNNPFSIFEGTLKSIDQTLITWRLNWVSGIYTTNDFQAEFLKALDKIIGKSNTQAAIILAIDPKDDISKAKAALFSFINVMLPSIEQSLTTSKQSTLQ
jgi:exosortase A